MELSDVRSVSPKTIADFEGLDPQKQQQGLYRLCPYWKVTKALGEGYWKVKKSTNPQIKPLFNEVFVVSGTDPDEIRVGDAVLLETTPENKAKLRAEKQRLADEQVSPEALNNEEVGREARNIGSDLVRVRGKTSIHVRRKYRRK